MKLFLNGAIVEDGDARIAPADRGFLLGDGLFETLRAEGGVSIGLPEHLERLEASATRLGIPLPLAQKAIADGIGETLAANGLRNAVAAVRVTLTRGVGSRGLLPAASPQPTLLITAVPYADPGFHGRSAAIASLRRNELSPTSQVKSLNYLDNILALREAAKRGFEEVLLLNTAGRLAGGSHANLFLVLDEVLATPPLSEGVLPGITRALVMELAQGEQVVRETALELRDLDRASEAFLTNSLMGIVPLTRVESRAFEIGPVATALSERYAALATPKRL